MRNLCSVAFLALASTSSHSLVLDRTFQKKRPIYVYEGQKCVAKGEEVRTPFKESLERGRCEPFAQTVGNLVAQYENHYAYSGTVTLIGPRAILSTAHVAKECLRKDVTCQFQTKFKGQQHAFEIAKVILHPSYKSDEPKAPAHILRDIAVVFLKEPAKGFPTMPIRVEPEKLKKGKPTAFMASNGYIYDNKTGLSDKTFARHIMVTELTIKNDVFVHEFKIPESEYKKCKPGTPEYPTQFLYRADVDSFLQGIVNSSDSGGPLVARYAGEDQLIGIGLGTYFYHCETVPEGEDRWDPISPFAKWLKETLEAGDPEYAKYQPALSAL